MLRSKLYVLLMFMGVTNAIAQPKADSSYIKSFARKNMIEAFTGLYATEFRFTERLDRRNNFKLRVNSSSFLGADISYKWVYLQYSFNVPGTQLDNKNKFNYKLLRFQFGNRRISFQPFYNYYNGLLIPERKRGAFEPFEGIAISNAGFDLFYYTNSKRFSSSSANIFSERQLKSAGSVFFCFTPLWQKIYWKTPTRRLIHDSTTFQLLASNPEWISVLPGIGYSYNFVPAKGWIIAPAVLFKIGGLKDIHPFNRSIKVLNDLQCWVNTGYTTDKYYVYLTASFERLHSNLFIRNLDRTDLNISITGGMRFGNMQKKILGIL